MSKRKGVSAEEKRQRMLDLFHERRDFFQLKELERLGPKEKGVVSQSVKEVVQALVDDGLVDTEKIGTSVYFWAFPSKATAARRCRLQQLEQQVADTRQQLSERRAQLSAAGEGREQSADRDRLLEQLEERRGQLQQVEQQLARYKDCDPETQRRVREQAATARQAADRWTDNVFNVKSWCRAKFNMEEAVIDKHFGIPEDFDYLE